MLDVAGQLAAFGHDQLAVADDARNPAGPVHDKPRACGQVARKLAEYFRDIDHCGSAQGPRLGDLHALAMNRCLDLAFDDENVTVRYLDSLELDVDADKQLAPSGL